MAARNQSIDYAPQRREIARRRGMPWLRVQTGVSLDGRTALLNGVSQWINGESARRDSHAWREQADAVLTGIGTILADDPRLNVRLVPTDRQPMRVIVDSQLSTPPGARIFEEPGPVRIYTASPDVHRFRALEARGATVISQQMQGHSVDLQGVIADLRALGVEEIHVEAGSKINGSLLQSGLVDELLVYVAPKLLGEGYGLAAIGSITRLNQGLDFSFQGAAAVGSDLRILLTPQAR